VLGRGLAWPLRVGEDGRLQTSEGARNVREHVELVLRTAPGERVRLAPFGAGLEELRNRPNTAATHRELAERIRRALQSWEPRLEVEGVDVAADPQDAETAIATVRYRLRATGEPARLAVAVALGGPA
jgi:uncharacterized protein